MKGREDNEEAVTIEGEEEKNERRIGGSIGKMEERE